MHETIFYFWHVNSRLILFNIVKLISWTYLQIIEAVLVLTSFPTSYSSWDRPWRPIRYMQVSSPYYLLREAVSSGLATANTAFCSNTQLLFCVLRVNISNNLKICFILHFLYVYLIAKPVFYYLILWNHPFQMFDISLPHFHPLKWTVKAVHSTHYERKRKPTF